MHCGACSGFIPKRPRSESVLRPRRQAAPTLDIETGYRSPAPAARLSGHQPQRVGALAVRRRRMLKGAEEVRKELSRNAGHGKFEESRGPETLAAQGIDVGCHRRFWGIDASRLATPGQSCW